MEAGLLATWETDRPPNACASNGTFLAYALSESPEIEVCSLRSTSAEPLVLQCRAQARPVTSMCMGRGALGGHVCRAPVRAASRVTEPRASPAVCLHLGQPLL